MNPPLMGQIDIALLFEPTVRYRRENCQADPARYDPVSAHCEFLVDAIKRLVVVRERSERDLT